MMAGYEPRVWRAPVAIGLASVVGLLAALVADGFWDAVSWAALGVPTVVGFWFWLRPRGDRRRVEAAAVRGGE